MSDNTITELDTYINNLNLSIVDITYISVRAVILIFNVNIMNLNYLTNITDYADITVVHNGQRTYIAISFQSMIHCHYYDFTTRGIVPHIRRVNRDQWMKLSEHMISRYEGLTYKLMRGERNIPSIMSPDQVKNLIEFNNLQLEIINGLNEYIISQLDDISTTIIDMIESRTYEDYLTTLQSVSRIHSSISIFLRQLVFRIAEYNECNPIKCGLGNINELIICIIHIPHYCNPVNYGNARIINMIGDSFDSIIYKTRTLIDNIRIYNDVN